MTATDFSRVTENLQACRALKPFEDKSPPFSSQTTLSPTIGGTEGANLGLRQSNGEPVEFAPIKKPAADHSAHVPQNAWRIQDFLVHLRLHYQLFILAAPFLCGGLLSPRIEWREFLLQFFNVHVLLFGGATAFNSYWDRDEGPIGGLRHPPKMQRWMHSASLALQFLGGMLALRSGWLFATIYAAAALLFWLYSSPHARWKGKPWLSFVAIGLSTGTASVLMGRLGADQRPLGTGDVVASVAVALILLSLYPLSQIYQMAADRERGDETFALKFGLRGVKRGFAVFYASGLLLLALSFLMAGLKPLAAALAVLGLAWGCLIGYRLRSLHGEESEYGSVMRMKYTTSAIFVFLLVGAIAWKHGALI